MARGDYVLTPEMAAAVQRTVQEHLNKAFSEHTLPRYAEPVGRVVRRHQGIMVTALAAASDAITSPSTGCMRVLKMNLETWELEETNVVLKIHNRYEFIEVEAGTLVRCEKLNSEWSLYGADCGNTGLNIDTTGCPLETL